MNREIAFFDSGVGGLTVLHACRKRMPSENYVYVSDSVNAPYGDKSKEEIVSLTVEALACMQSQNLKALVIACNTVTSAALGELRSFYSFPIIGMEPAIKPALAASDDRRILVLATPFTLANKKYQDLVNLLDRDQLIDAVPALELVEFAEEFDFDSPQLKRYIRQLVGSIQWESYHAVVLGCTHFLYFSKQLRKFVPPHIAIIDGVQGTIQQLQRMIARNPSFDIGRLKCFVSGVQMDSEVLMPYLNLLDGGLIRSNFGYTSQP